MADLIITPSLVLASSRASREQLTAAVSITAGQAIGLNTDGLAVLADADSAVIIFRGIALNSAAVGQPVIVGSGDNLFAIGASVTAGEAYAVSSTAGGICPLDDVISAGKFVQIVGIGLTAGKIQVPRANSVLTSLIPL